VTNVSKENPTADELATLYLQAGWMASPDPHKMSLAVQSGSEWYVVRDGAGSLLGIGRFITDYVRYAFIVDVIVNKDYQGHGIGTAIMNEILDTCRTLKIDSVNLWPSQGNASFYERFGFYALPPDQPHMKLKN
jgi:GNAT superfamily N-acetyltransferase